jgi:hypothetical protein
MTFEEYCRIEPAAKTLPNPEDLSMVDPKSTKIEGTRRPLRTDPCQAGDSESALRLQQELPV